MFFWGCPFCGLGTLWAFVTNYMHNGKETGYKKYQCTRCRKIERLLK